MNRFVPDAWWEALLRPLTMAAPSSHVYVEMTAPDLRFLVALLLVVLLVFLRMRKRAAGSCRPVLVLGTLVALSFAPWLLTSGNGRYFVPFLLLAGPLTLGLLYALPVSRGARFTGAIALLALQAVVVFDDAPWGAWSLTTWERGRYFDVEVPRDIASQPATFVTITSQSNSLVAPQFHPASHWINIAHMSTDLDHSLEARRARAIFQRSERLYLLAPAVDKFMTDGRLPWDELLDTMDRHLAPQLLAVDRQQSCRLLPSRSVARLMLGPGYESRPEQAARQGFWLCALRYPVAPPPPPDAPLPELDAAFTQVEQRCPRFFPPGSASTSLLPDGAVRNYVAQDMKVYVMEDGYVYYKYWRALNPERIGSLREVIAGSFRFDCSNIRGRSGMPWDRSI